MSYFTIFLSGYGLSRFWYDLTVRILKLDGKQVIGGIHFHHSIIGLVSLLGSIYYLQNGNVKMSIEFFIFSLGVFIAYKIKFKKIPFLSREKNV